MRACADWESGKAIDSRQCAEAVKQGIMVPDMRGGFREACTALELVQRDRGGMLFSPSVGLHENVGCLDFESMFPNIIVNRNVSYETVSDEDTGKPGFMGCFTAPFLDRRLRFKHMRDGFPVGSREWLWCQQRQSALKLMLVVIYGYSGCYANRFANVRVFREINRQARDAMVRALNISLENGFNVVYGDTDSIFTKKPGATERDYRDLASTISEATGFPMGLDRHFRFLVLLNKATDPKTVATRRYYGKLYNGELFYRGLELRRRDTPPYIKDLQEEMIRTLLDADNAYQVLNQQLEEAISLAEEAYNNILYGSVDPSRLVISKRLRRKVEEYKSRQPHIVAAMLNQGNESEASYVFVNTERENPFKRVMPASRIDEGHKAYDRGKYAERVRRAAWTLLRPFIPEESRIGGEALRESRLDTFS
ncbi:MAG: DNA polymerase domain-containing protein [Candidatus Bathyarchaeia archaeon]